MGKDGKEAGILENILDIELVGFGDLLEKRNEVGEEFGMIFKFLVG